jgi:hypothetical protein
MRSIGTRTAFAAALCSGVAMVGASVHGMLGIDAELQRSAVAAHERAVKDSVRVSMRTWSDGRGHDCPAPPPRSRQRI